MPRIYKKQPLYIEQYESINSDIFTGLVNSHDITQKLADDISMWFNNNSSEKTRLKNEINNISGTLATLRFAASSNLLDTAIYTEEFNNYTNVDQQMSGDAMCNISTSEGTMSLGIKEVSEVKGFVVKSVSGNGSKGNFNVGMSSNGKPVYISRIAAHDKEADVVDGNPLSWLEYQNCNLPDTSKARMKYNLEWCKGKQTGDPLQLKVIIGADQAKDINCVSISPYIPQGSTEPIIVSSIKTSVDGINYTPIYKNKPNINVAISATSATINKDMVNRLDKEREKFKSMGIFFFEKVNAKYIEIILVAPNSYPEKMAYTYYMEITKDKNNKEIKTRANPASIPKTITADTVQPGRYTYQVKGKDGKNVTHTVEKAIELVQGWRYCIGVKDISAFNYTYLPSSQIVSKTIKFAKPFKKLCILSDEIFPEKLTKVVGQTYGFIRYYISIDDVNWVEVLPLHRQQSFAPTTPKIIEIGDTPDFIDDLSTGTLRGTSIDKVRVKVVMSTSSPDISPTLESYSVKVMY